MALTKQAKVLSPSQIKAVLSYLDTTRYPNRSRLMFLLSVRAGLRAKEISALRWRMVCDAELQMEGRIALDDEAAKGSGGGRSIPMNRELRAALTAHFNEIRPVRGDTYVFRSERGARMSAKVIVNWFKRLYTGMGFEGCSSHSGRRTFVTTLARNIGRVGGSLRDVQMLAGHASIGTTQRYIEADSDAMRKVVDLV